MGISKQSFYKSLIFVAITTAISACTNSSHISKQATAPLLPVSWSDAQNVSSDKEKFLGDWQFIIDDVALQSAINTALENNFTLNAKYQEFLIAKQQLIVSNATDLPELSLGVDQSRRKTVNSSNIYSNDASISLELQYEVDIWGKLRDEQKQAQLRFQAAELSFLQEKNQVITNVVNAWFNLVEARTLENLYIERANNLRNNLEIIDASYQLGLSQALDVYLAQNDVNSELARIEQQQQTVSERKRLLEILLGYYPSGQQFSDITLELPSLNNELFIDLPANTLTASYSIQAKWFDLLATDMGVAIAHKNRFPSFRLSASGGDSSDELSNLLDGGSLAWSVAGSITAPLFNAGRLKALEEQAKLTVKQKEQEYLLSLYNTFSDIENNISNHFALNQQLNYFEKAKENALAAESLSFNQYLKGLVEYSTVLEAQRRAFDAQTNVIQLANQIIQNRIALYAELGGSQLSAEFKDKFTAQRQVSNEQL
ncbi:efflux transporter outer membrane subunit [Thalassotalea euphylliae]|uniref:efflux transporter outer membrane subunit n=1 Tax=Thalassotalea euphylliae TaxID=1655234 RepID=UPI003644EBF9